MGALRVARYMDTTDLAHLWVSIRPSFFHLHFGIPLFHPMSASSLLELGFTALIRWVGRGGETEWVWLGLDAGWMDLV